MMCSDFFYMSTDEAGSMPMLVAKSTRSGRVSATALESKGVTAHAVRFFAEVMMRTGLRKFINFSDNESSLLLLKAAAARSVKGLEAIPRECPVGDHQANGHAESAVRQVKDMMRTIRIGLERNLGQILDETDPILTWLPTFSADAVSIFRKMKDGKTRYEKETGKRWSRPRLSFGERCMLKLAEEKTGAKKRDWKPRMTEVRFVGYHSRTGALLGLTRDGLKIGTRVSRLPASERWLLDGWSELRGLPWEVAPRARAAPKPLGDAQQPAAAAEGSKPLAVEKPAEKEEAVPNLRGFSVRKADVADDKFGPTPGCPGCNAILEMKTYQVAHNDGCRQRIFRRLCDDKDARTEKFIEKMSVAMERLEKVTADSEKNAEARGSGSVEKKDEGVQVEEPEKEDGGSVDMDEGDIFGEVEYEPSGGEEADELEEQPQASSETRRQETERAAAQTRKEGGAVPEALKRPAKSSRWQTRGGIWQRKREADTATEDLHRSSEAASAASTSAPLVVELPADVPAGPRAMEDLVDSTLGPAPSSRPQGEGGDISSVDLGPSAEPVKLGPQKAEFLELASVEVDLCFRKQGMDITAEECRQIAALQIELAGCHVLELFSPKRFSEQASSFGLKPGFAVDLCEQKPYGPEKGQHWDLSRDKDVKELAEMIEYEDPWLITGSPPCDPFSQLQHLT